jgi:pyruvate dehydrogenase E1 component alpha subunit
VVFLLENNGLGMGTRVERAHAGLAMHHLADAFLIRSDQVDGMNVLSVRRAAKEAIDYARSGKGPFFLEAITYRFRGHSQADPVAYRGKDEEDEWKRRGPILVFRQEKIDSGMVTEEEFADVDRSVEEEIAEAVDFAENSAELTIEGLYEDVYKE